MQTWQQLVEDGKHKGVGVPPDGLLPLPREVTIGGRDQVKEEGHRGQMCARYSVVHVKCTLYPTRELDYIWACHKTARLYMGVYIYSSFASITVNVWVITASDSALSSIPGYRTRVDTEKTHTIVSSVLCLKVLRTWMLAKLLQFVGSKIVKSLCKSP